jgi:hypothetical protein
MTKKSFITLVPADLDELKIEEFDIGGTKIKIVAATDI